MLGAQVCMLISMSVRSRAGAQRTVFLRSASVASSVDRIEVVEVSVYVWYHGEALSCQLDDATQAKKDRRVGDEYAEVQ